MSSTNCGHSDSFRARIEANGTLYQIEEEPSQFLRWALNTDDALTTCRKQANKQNTRWPSRNEVRDRLTDTLHSLLSDAVDKIIETPIAAGETSVVATTPWSEYPELTGGEPVLLLSKTRAARDEAYEMSRQSDDVNAAKLTALSRCPIVRGKYDDHDPLNNLASGQEPISEWIKRECYEKWVPYSIVHQKLEEQYKSQTGDVLPCCNGGGCPSRTQSNSRSLSKIREEETQYDVIHATQAYIQRSCSIRGLNVVFDRRPSFSIGSQERTLNEVVENYLSEIDISYRTVDDLLNLKTGTPGMESAIDDINSARSPNWDANKSYTHTYAPAIAKAVLNAEYTDNHRYVGRVTHSSFHQTATNHSDDVAADVEVVVTENGNIELVNVLPPLNTARCVIGLDPYPVPERWELTTMDEMQPRSILTEEERHKWRLFECGLLIVQIGDATRPLTTQNFKPEMMEVLIEEITNRPSTSNLRTAVTTEYVEDEVEEMLPDSDRSESVLHYGEQWSRDVFSDEEAGLIVGCNTLSDRQIISRLSLLGASAEFSISKAECDNCGGAGCPGCLGTGKKRERPRQFVGQDSDIAERILASVREKNVFESTGCYAAACDTPSEFTPVLVWTSAIPERLVNVSTEFRRFTESQKLIVKRFKQADSAVSAREIADNVSECKETVANCLDELVDFGIATVNRSAGKYGADLYSIEYEPSAFLSAW